MAEPHDLLAEMFARTEAPAADPIFTLAVIAEVERREAIRLLVGRTGYVALALVLLWVGWPVVQVIVGGLAATPAPVLLAAGGAIVVVAGYAVVNRLDLSRADLVRLVELMGISHL